MPDELMDKVPAKAREDHWLAVYGMGPDDMWVAVLEEVSPADEGPMWISVEDGLPIAAPGEDALCWWVKQPGLQEIAIAQCPDYAEASRRESLRFPALFGGSK